MQLNPESKWVQKKEKNRTKRELLNLELYTYQRKQEEDLILVLQEEFASTAFAKTTTCFYICGTAFKEGEDISVRYVPISCPWTL